MISIRFYHGKWYNPLHLLIMAVTRSRVVHCDVVVEVPYHSDVFKTGTIAFTASFGREVGFESPEKEDADLYMDFHEPEEARDAIFYTMMEDVFGTPYDYRAALSYVWPWVRESKTRMNCVEVCLWAMRKAGIPTPRHLPTPGGLERWCRRLKEGEDHRIIEGTRITGCVNRGPCGDKPPMDIPGQNCGFKKEK